jgi:pimeloyl-ACP methyl ester carboxylesterase
MIIGERMKRILGASLLALVLMVTLAPAPAQAHDRNPFGDGISLYMHPSRAGWCVAFTAPAPADLTYCQPFRPVRGHVAEVLTPGATYTRTYWDWAGFGGRYSYVGRALRDGHATVAYDRVNTGLSTDVTMATDATTLHRIVSGLRALGYQRINSVSHSLGSGIALAEAASYGDVDALVVTGYLHRPSNPLVTAGNYPANQDPQFAAAGLDGGWLTTRPGARLYGFHAVDSDSVLVAQDEDRKDLVSRTSLLDFLGQRGAPAATNVSRLVTVPVLVLVGQRDAIFCLDPAVFDCADPAALSANEAPYYLDATVASQPLSGHDLALHPTADDSYDTIANWLRAVSLA